MSPGWTSDQITNLAPDAASAKNGRGLATLRKWSNLGIRDAFVWGECQGSGKNPYLTQIDTREPAFRCSCPSRKFPCKHGLGLFLLFAEENTSFSEAELPPWVAEWAESRTQRAEKKAEKVAKTAETIADPEAQAKRSAARLQKVSAGVQELDLWLADRMRQGLAAVQQESYAFWATTAARMVDAQAPGLARQLRELSGVPHSGTGWHEKLLEGLSQLYLTVEGFKRIDELAPMVQADLRNQIGWSLSQEEVLAIEGYSDRWWVMGQRFSEEDRLKIRHTWLWGEGTNQTALLLEFAHGKQPFTQSLLLGSVQQAELAFYPSAYPQRALIKSRQEATVSSQQPIGYSTFREAIAAYGQALSVCPWLVRFPLFLQSVQVGQIGDIWGIQDREGAVLPLSAQCNEAQQWQIVALSGGKPFDLFGEWDGQTIHPISVWIEGDVYGFNQWT
jgi:hypothetical protein